MINTLLFDMDGVIVDSEPIAIDRTIKILSDHNLPYDLGTLYSCIGTSFEQTYDILENMIKEKLPANFQELEAELIKSETINYNNHKMDNLDIVLDYAIQNKFKLALCSSSPLDVIYLILNSLNITNKFDIILSGESFTHTKPHPEIYLNAMERLNVNPEQCIVIEDSRQGIEAGKSANITTVALINPLYKIDTSKADYSIRNLIELLPLLNSLNQDK